MATTPVKIEIDGYKAREVYMVTYEFEKATDVEGQMSGIARGGKIHLIVKALNDGNPDLMAWMIDKNLAKDGVITFLETKNNTTMKTIAFKTAYCVAYEERWEDKVGHVEEFTITCRQIEFGNVTYTNDWA